MQKLIMFCVFLCYTIFTNCQTLNYTLPLDKSNFRGPIKSCFIYEYSLYSRDTTTSADYKPDAHPTISYHFDEKIRMIYKKQYGEDTIIRITYFLYGTDGNIEYSVSGDSLQLSEYICIDPLLNKLIMKNHKEEISHQIELISKNTDAIIKKYHYDFDDLFILITSNINEPPSFIHFDTNNNIVKKVHYYYHKSDLLKSTESREYSMGRLQKIFLETANKKWKRTDIIYDSLNNVILESITSSNEQKNRTIRYKYLNGEDVEIKIYNVNGNIIRSEEVNDYYNKRIRVIQSFNSNKDSTKKEISYLDEYRNIIKKYQISECKIYVKEHRYTFY